MTNTIKMPKIEAITSPRSYGTCNSKAIRSEIECNSDLIRYNENMI